jgi:hypothetical protein
MTLRSMESRSELVIPVRKKIEIWKKNLIADSRGKLFQT